ncbi:hypothetical protein PR202_ga20777 [Eleusine coracana subsp. coracana]|uniref:Sugar phosphate transporter domain-containing protein n=1 Tax=Eleusine coracana subsp. coracana TaxID=191504 RepID=A0AAV5CZG9_ELECO|nr:hypothetical protein PR202_ga20777 [Eleusine coracana subsp. coracana]
MSPITHSVTNSLKCVVIIVSSVIFFITQISPINALGNITVSMSHNTVNKTHVKLFDSELSYYFYCLQELVWAARLQLILE